MKTIKTLVIISLLSILGFTSCEDGWLCIKGEGEIITETLSIDDFTGIDLSNAGKVYIVQGPDQLVEVEAQGNIIDRLKTKVSDDVWSIDLEKGTYCSYDLTVYITVPDLNKVSVSGAGDVHLDDFIDQDKMDISISGAGKVELNSFDGADELLVKISGSGKIEGNKDWTDLKELEIKISGSGKYDAYPIETENCYVNISGAGNCMLTAIDDLEAHISGAGSVHYKGNPYITTDITGAGSVVNEN